MRVLILAMLLTGCAERGALSYGEPFDLSEIKCPMGKPYYEELTITTNFSTMEQKAEISWQCPGDGERVYMHVMCYHLSMDRTDDVDCEP